MIYNNETLIDCWLIMIWWTFLITFEHNFDDDDELHNILTYFDDRFHDSTIKQIHES
jgi:hypothetical protein